MTCGAAQPVVREASAEELRRRLDAPPSERAIPFEEVLQRVCSPM
jgi:hypothetical protein